MNYTEQSFKSKKYYSSITGLKFTPRKHVNVDAPKFKKGEIVSSTKLLFIKPRIKYAETDLYEKIYYDWEGASCKSLLNPFSYATSIGADYDHENNEFYRKAKVVIEFKGNVENKYFTCDNDALNFINDLKEKCKLCDNELL